MELNQENRSNVIQQIDVVNSPEQKNRFPVSEWLEILARIKDNIRHFNKLTEQEFLTIGGKIQKYHTDSTEITKTALATTENLSGSEVDNSIKGLNKIMKEFNNFLESSESKIAKSVKVTQDILSTIGEINGALSGFKKIVKYLRIFGISTKIESARLTREVTNFSDSAENVNKLCELIKLKYSHIKTKLTSIFILLDESSTKIQNLSENQKNKTSTALAKIKSNLDFLSEKPVMSSGSGKEILKMSEKLSTDIGEIVVSMQYHDITRQKLEHIEFVTLESSRKLREETSELQSSPAELLNHLNETGKLLEL